MPSNLQIGAFVLGAVLLLLGFTGGQFKLFGAEITSSSGRTLRWLAAALGALFIAGASLPMVLARARMGESEVGIDRPGGDYKDFVAKDLDDCRDACVRETKCQAITFNQQSRQCWMKSAAPLRRDDTTFISAVKVQLHSDSQ